MHWLVCLLLDEVQASYPHRHGLTQKKTPWYDGVAAVQVELPLRCGGVFQAGLRSNVPSYPVARSHITSKLISMAHLGITPITQPR